MADDAPSTPSTTSRPTARGRPRPRAGIQRKTKAERDAFAKEEAERQKARAAEHGSTTRGVRGGRALTRGARGGATSGQRDGPSGGGGIFGGAGTGVTPVPKAKYEGYAELLDGGVSGPGGENSTQGAAAPGEGASRAKGTGGGGGRGGTSTGSKAKSGGTKTVETLETTTDEEPDDKNKRDIERIWISSDAEDDIFTSSSRKGKQKATNHANRPSRAGLGLRPVRAPRTLREEEEEDGVPQASRKKRTATSKKSDAEVQEVSSDEDGDAMDIDTDSVQFLKEQPSSPELRRRTLKKQLGMTSKYGRDAKASANETLEERAERLRVQDDIDKLRDTFDNTLATEDEPATNPSDGELLLFQLPPLTPFLIGPSHFAVKTEPLANLNGTTIDPDAIPDVKPDPDAISKPTLQTDGLLTAAEPMRLPAGVVGKLKVHKSGKVTMDWGGTDMEVRLGSEVDFLQDVVLVQSPGKDENGMDNDGEVDGENGKEKQGKAFALGQVRKKMVLIPDWVKLYD